MTRGDFARAVVFVRSGAERSASEAAAEVQRRRWAPAGFAQQPGAVLAAGESAGLIARAMKDAGPESISDQKAFETLRARNLLRADATPSTAVSGQEALTLLTGLRETLDEDELEGPAAFAPSRPPGGAPGATKLSGSGRSAPSAGPAPAPVAAGVDSAGPPSPPSSPLPSAPGSEPPESFDEFDASPVTPPSPSGPKPAPPAKTSPPAKTTPPSKPALAASASSTLPRARTEPLPEIPPMRAGDAAKDPAPTKPPASKAKKSPWGAGKPIPQRTGPASPPAAAPTAPSPKGGG